MKTTKTKTKRRNTRGLGYMHKRGNTYWLDYTDASGKRIRTSLRDDKGNPITVKADAEDARTRQDVMVSSP